MFLHCKTHEFYELLLQLRESRYFHLQIHLVNRKTVRAYIDPVW